MSEYGELGYDPAQGDTDPESPVQDQYTGTWEMYQAPNADERVGKLFARHVLNATVNPLVYITNGEIAGIKTGESITFEAHVVSGKPEYSYQWSFKKDGENSWASIEDSGSTWSWNTAGGDEGTYAIRCQVTDAKSRTGEVTWEGFTVSLP